MALTDDSPGMLSLIGIKNPDVKAGVPQCAKHSLRPLSTASNTDSRLTETTQPLGDSGKQFLAFTADF
jgi:hypothetical protein